MMRRWLIEKLGGYPDLESALNADKEAFIDEAIEAVRDMGLEAKHRWLTLAVKRLFNTVGPDDILRIESDTQWVWKGKPMRQAEMTLLKAEATQLQMSRLWETLKSELRYQANKRMYVNSEEVIDLVAGKLLVYYIDIIETRLKRMLEQK